MNNRADLHMHTLASDGMFAPQVNVRMASEAGLAAIAITDHDTLAGIPEALAAGEQYGITVVPGVEISTSARGKDIHILGYGFRVEDAELSHRLQTLRNVRSNRNEGILLKLAELGMPVTLGELEAAAGKSSRGDGSVGRPHIAQVLVDKGFAADIRDAFNLYLGEGKPAFVLPPRITPAEAVSWIHEAGGVAIIAHPGIYGEDELVEELLDGEADGIEAYHSDHDEAAEQRYARLAINRGKLITGGSDFHGVRDGVAFHGAIGHPTVDASIVTQLLGRLSSQ